jgi:hypothetical protein
MTVPGWLFDELADAVADPAELRACLEAWSRLLAGFDVMRYRELRAVGAGSWESYALGKAVHGGYWRSAVQVDPHLACRQPGGYACPACTAQRLDVSRQRLAAMRKRGEVEFIGVAPRVFYRVP